MILRGALVIGSSLAVLALVVPALACVAAGAVGVARSGRIDERVYRIGSRALRWLLVAGLAWQVAFGYGDWVHLHWTVELLLLVAFLASGFGHQEDPAARLEAGAASPRRTSFSASLRWFAWTGGVALLPLVLITALPSVFRDVRGIGAPLPELVELAAWGLGGELPAWLEAVPAYHGEREVGHLPRNVTAPFAAGLLCAWYWCGYALLRVVAAVLPASRWRSWFELVGPFVVTVLLRATGVLDGRLAFDAGLFSPGASGSAIWRSDPDTLRAFGPVLVLGGVAALVALGVDRWAGKSAALSPCGESSGAPEPSGLDLAES